MTKRKPGVIHVPKDPNITFLHLKVHLDLVARLDAAAEEAINLPSELPRRWTRHGLALALIERGIRQIESVIATQAKGAEDASLAREG
jgi:hypothetical protein